MSIETIIENAALVMERFANNPDIGYDQQFRWGERGDYDCSSAIIYAWEFAGVPVKSAGATYTGNMYSVFTANGFDDVTSQIDLAHGSGLQRGDVLLNHKNHTAMYIGGGKTAEASINEYGTTTGGQPGDQTGKEFLLRLYRNYPWDCVLRFTGKSSGGGAAGIVGAGSNAPTYFYMAKLPLLKKGHTGPYVETLQMLLKADHYYTGNVDGIFGAETELALKEFQGDSELEADGECGGLTWSALLGG